MSTQNLSLSVSVESFFQASNWEGLQRQLNKPPQSQPWQRLTVQHFFTQSNWSGASITKNAPSMTESLPLTLTVQEFCQFITWKGKPEIAARTNSVPSIDLHSKTKQITVNNLFDLL